MIGQTDNMASPRGSAHKESIETRVALGFFVVLGDAIAIGLLGHRTAGRAFATWSSVTHAAWWFAIAATAGGVAAMITAFRASENSRQFWIPFGASVLVTIVAFAIAELAVRTVTRPDPNG